MSSYMDPTDESCYQMITADDSSKIKLSKEFFQYKTNLRVKKENFNTHLIRTIQRIIIYIQTGIKPKIRKFIHFNLMDPELNEIWRRIDEAFYRNSELFLQRVKLKSKPPLYKSYNSAFLKLFFEGHSMKEFFGLALELLFHYKDCDVLKINFKIRCCTNECHTEDCSSKWNRFEDYLKFFYIDELLGN